MPVQQAFHALTGKRDDLVGISGDIYSWAILVYEIVTGTHPFDWVTEKISLSSQRAMRTLW